MPDKSTARPGPTGPPEPWASFLRALDALLKETVNLHCIGGFVITRQFRISRETSDIDVLAAVPNRMLAELQGLAGLGSDLHRRFKVYLQPVTITTYPEQYESRLARMWPSLKLEHLRLYALEPHDLALTKLERNSDVDRQDILDLARAGHLDPTTLRERYVKEFRPNLVSGLEKHDLTLDLWIEMCWPKSESP
jgi:hypothetical protein